MDEMKQQIESKLIANVIIEKCKSQKSIIFRDAWCTQERIIRFTTPYFRGLFCVVENNTRKWKTGDYVMYEIHNDQDGLNINCVLDVNHTSGKKKRIADTIISACDLEKEKNAKEMTIGHWALAKDSKDINKTFDRFDEFLSKTVYEFETHIYEFINNHPVEVYEEGTIRRVTLNKYERNRKAREACLLANGYSCVICGINFEESYGKAFKGIIEVHHKIPLSSIGEEYVVDPVNDLVPVCPNCHTALHSKANGETYTVEELISIRKNL